MALVNIGLTVPQDLASSGDQGLNVAALKITVPADGTYKLLSMSMIVTTAGGASLRLGMYDDTGTQATQPRAPGNLLAQTGAQALVDGLNTLPVLVPTIITAGDRWINYNQSANVVWTQHDTHVQGNSLFYVAPFAPFDNPFTPGSANDSAIYPVYATFDFTPTPTGGGGGGRKKRDIRRTTLIRPDKRLRFEDWQAFSDYREEAQKLRAELAKPKPAPAKVAAAVERVRKVVVEVAPDYEFVSAKADAEAIKAGLDRAQKFLAEMAKEFVERKAREQEESDVIEAVTAHERHIIESLLH